jgi:hypothetical protein
MKYNPYMGNSDAELITWSVHFLIQCHDQKELFNIDEAGLAEANTVLDDFRALWEKCQTGERSKLLTQQKNEKEILLKKIERALVKWLDAQPVMTDTWREQFGMHVHSKTKTVQPPPTIHVGFSLAIHKAYQLLIRLWVLETGDAFIPKNMAGVMICWKISDTVITRHEDLHNSQLLTKHIDVLSFPQEDSGKYVYVSCRWVNTKGEQGEWAPIQVMRIP